MPRSVRAAKKSRNVQVPAVDTSLLEPPREPEEVGELPQAKREQPKKRETKDVAFDATRVFGGSQGSQGDLELDPDAARFRARQGQAGSRHVGATPTRPCDCMLCRYVPG